MLPTTSNAPFGNPPVTQEGVCTFAGFKPALRQRLVPVVSGVDNETGWGIGIPDNQLIVFLCERAFRLPPQTKV